MALLLYGCTTRALTKHLKRKLDKNYTRMLHATSKKITRQHPIKRQLSSYLPSISQSIKIKRARLAEECH